MHIADIENDLAAGDIRGIEDAFRALVGWPNEAKTEGGTRTLRKALRLCCLNLHGNDSIMPSGTAELIAEQSDEPIGVTYHDGAAAVLERTGYWTMRISTAPKRREVA